MTPREKTVIRAIVKALRGQGDDEMDALSMSYPAGRYAEQTKPQKMRRRAALLLETLTNADG